MQVQQTATLIRTVFDNFDRREFASAATSIAEDCEIVNIPFGATYRGPEGYKQFAMAWARAFPDSKLEITNLFTTEEQALVEYTGRGTHTAPLTSPMGEIPPTGRKAELHLCDVLTLRNGKIVVWHSYYDAFGFLQQLGLIPAQG